MRTRRPQRAIHLIDIENLAGQPRPTRDQVVVLRDTYERTVNVGQDDHVVVAVNHGAAMVVGSAWSGRLVLGSGPDGADLALLDVADVESIADRFDEVVIASGDGIFAQLAARLIAAGVIVRVVSRPESLSRRLRLAAGGGLIALTYGTGPHDPHTATLGEVA